MLIGRLGFIKVGSLRTLLPLHLTTLLNPRVLPCLSASSSRVTPLCPRPIHSPRNQQGTDSKLPVPRTELLVSFFRAATPLLSPTGTIVLTIFEGEPYELWNVRDLARHVGLKVGRSFRFQSAAYPGYKHARTLGNIEGGGGWKGEERAARTFLFEVVGEGENGVGGAAEKRRGGKRKRGDSSDEEDG